ncbi:MAG: hypothetical protein PUC29_01695 [Clostridia bacterium]|nr:hypothetical protein [Clostridia bacterium]
MAENRQCQPVRETVCIDTYRVLDSCRDKDCFEDTRVYLTEYGQQLLDSGAAVRVKSAKTVWSYIDIDEVPFNRGFYQIDIRIFIRLTIEVCVGPGHVEEICGIAAVEKRVILFGSEGNVRIFKSEGGCSGFCPSGRRSACKSATNLPVAVLETVDPIVLSYKVIPPHMCKCCCCVCDIPEQVVNMMDGNMCEQGGNILAVTLGMFSVIRIERPAQYLVGAAEYSVPEKECPEADDDDPCKMFRKMPFPVGEFYPPSQCAINRCPPRNNDSHSHCGCGD